MKRLAYVGGMALAIGVINCGGEAEDFSASNEAVTEYLVEIAGDLTIDAEDPSGFAALQGEIGLPPAVETEGHELRLNVDRPLVLQVEGRLTVAASTRWVIPVDVQLQAQSVVVEAGSVLRVFGDIDIKAETYEGEGWLDTSGAPLPVETQPPVPEAEPAGPVGTTARGQMIDVSGADGIDGGPGEVGRDGEDASCNIFNPNPAGPGMDGGTGQDGTPGNRGGNIVISVGAMGGRFRTAGGNAGDGGPGGLGGTGGDGCCTAALFPRHAADGGDGGNGGNGGDGGPGGDITIFMCGPVDPARLITDLQGGIGGFGGVAGIGGPGGDGQCLFANDGDRGRLGFEGTTGVVGPDGVLSLIQVPPNDPLCM